MSPISGVSRVDVCLQNARLWLKGGAVVAVLVVGVGCRAKREVEGTSYQQEQILVGERAELEHDAVEVTWWGAPPPLPRVEREDNRIVSSPTPQGGWRVERVQRRKATAQQATSDIMQAVSEQASDTTEGKSVLQDMKQLIMWVVLALGLGLIYRYSRR